MLLRVEVGELESMVVGVTWLQSSIRTPDSSSPKITKLEALQYDKSTKIYYFPQNRS